MSQHRHPYLIVPNGNVGDYLRNIFNIPKKNVLAGKATLSHGFSRDTTFMVYTEGWRADNYEKILEALSVCDYTIIFVPEIQRVYR